MDFWSAAIGHISDLVLPPRCPSCGVTVQENHQFCQNCWSLLEFLAGPSCVQCGQPFAFGRAGEIRCGKCIADPPRFDALRAVVRYNEVSAKIVMRLKYGGKLGIADLISEQMHHLLVDLGPADVIIPVPLHRTRLWTRGFNQSVLIAQSIARRSHVQIASDILIRTRPTSPLKKMNNVQRRQTVGKAFAVTPKGHSTLPGKHIWLVDDVYTSGSTTNACARVLKLAGAQNVSILCWARVSELAE